jgi:hypothetical protein
VGLNPSRDAGATEGTGGAARQCPADRGGGGMHVCKEAAGCDGVCVIECRPAKLMRDSARE